jgi:hypothetical protein
MDNQTRSRTLHEQVSGILFDIHSFAMDASNDPTSTNIRAMQDRVRELERLLPDWYYTSALAQGEAARKARA